MKVFDPSKMEGFTFPEKLKSIVERVKYRDSIIFQGAVFFKNLNFIEKFVMNKMKVVEGDYRDWKAIEAWAEGIAKELKK